MKGGDLNGQTRANERARAHNTHCSAASSPTQKAVSENMEREDALLMRCEEVIQTRIMASSLTVDEAWFGKPTPAMLPTYATQCREIARRAFSSGSVEAETRLKKQQKNKKKLQDGQAI